MKAVYKDLALLAATREELDTVDSLLWQIETLELGEKIASENMHNRRREQMAQERKEKNTQTEVNCTAVLLPEAPRQKF